MKAFLPGITQNLLPWKSIRYSLLPFILYQPNAAHDRDHGQPGEGLPEHRLAKPFHAFWPLYVTDTYRTSAFSS